MLKRLFGWAIIIFASTFWASFGPIHVYAVPLQSQNYSLDESVVGVGDINQSSSSSYEITNATGSLTVGNAASSSFQVESGPITTHDPTLSFNIATGNINFDSFSPTNPTVTTAAFSILNYTSYGYVVQIIGDPPAYSGHTISAMSETGSSQIGIEQFGINLVANTLPVSVGANPDNGQFGFGSVPTDYATSNQYRYVSGETIASAPKSSGITTYTISYLINVSGITPAGVYTSGQTLIVTGTY